MRANQDELKGMRRVVTYLRDRATRLNQAADKCDPGEVKQAARLKALGLIEAATMIENGIEREEKS